MLADTMKNAKMRFLESLPQLLSQARQTRHLKEQSEYSVDTSADERHAYEVRCEVVDTVTVTNN